MSKPSRQKPLPGLLRSIAVDIPATWTAAEACAVFELLDDLRDKVWALYGMQIQKHLRKMRDSGPFVAKTGSTDGEF
jgi:hypothetical protein